MSNISFDFPASEWIAETKARPTIPASESKAPWESYIPGAAGFEGIWTIMLQTAEEELPAWSIYPSLRDAYLRRFYKLEPHAAGAVYSMAARIKSLPSKIEGTPRTKKRFQKMLYDVSNLPSLIERTCIDLLTQDNGAFWYLHGAGNPDRPLVGQVVEIRYLDAAQCWRTFDPDYPVIYTNPYTHTYHRLHRTRVVAMSSMEQPTELARGIGLCAISRAFLAMQQMRDIGVYNHEKISGRFKRAIGWANGITDKQLEKAIQASDEDADNKGFTRFMGIPFIPTNRDKVEMGMLNLAAIPDGFNTQEYTTLYIYALALGFGVDAREFWPATAAGATKADAAIQHLKARGKGIADLIQTIERAINWHVLPEGVEFKFDYADDEQDKEVAELQAVRIANLEKLVGIGAISGVEARALAIAQGIIDPQALTNMQAPEQADDSAPLTEGEEQEAPPAPTPEPEPPPPTPPTEEKGHKDTPVEPFTETEIAALFKKFTALPSLEELRNATAA